VADRSRTQDRPGQSTIRAERGGPVEREIRSGRDPGGHHRVYGADYAGADVVHGVGSPVGPQVSPFGQILQDEIDVRSRLLAVPRRVQCRHATVQCQRS